MAVITISREEGSRSKEIAQALEKKLKYLLVDGKLIASEIQGNSAFKEATPKAFASLTGSYDAEYSKLALYVFEKLTKTQNVILMGRNAGFLLKDVPGVLRIRFVGSREVRIKRLMERYGATRKEAEKMIEHKDSERSQIAKFLFRTDITDPANFDLVINTDKVDVDDVIAIIKAAVKAIDAKNDIDELKKKFKNLYIEQQIYNAIVYEKKIAANFLTLNLHEGTLEITGSVVARADKEKIAEIASKFSGVKKIDNKVTISKLVFRM